MLCATKWLRGSIGFSILLPRAGVSRPQGLAARQGARRGVHEGRSKHPLAEQLLRACYSVPLNIAEGSGRKGAREFRRFLDVAGGSLLEVQSAIDVARELGYVPVESYAQLDELASEAGKTLWGLLRNVSDRARRPN